MSHSSPEEILRNDQVYVPNEHAWHRRPNLALAVGAGGIVLSLLIAIAGGSFDRLLFSWLVAYMFFLSIALGGLFLVIVLFVTRAGWGVTIRRTAENIMATLPWFALLFIPIAIGIHQLFHWSHADAVAHDTLLQAKEPYLNTGFFVARALVYFATWTFLARLFRGQSGLQDESGDLAITERLQRYSAPALIAFSVTATFAAIDWMMSLDPHWYSTIFGVYFFAGANIALLAFLTLALVGLRSGGFVQQTVTVEHFHDIGKLLFGFTIFWAYIGFSQYFLIWYANIPEETAWYAHRSVGSWATLTFALCVGHFAIPFFFFMPRAVKRSTLLMTVGALWMLAMHYLDLYWLIMPTHDHHGVHPSLLDVTTLVGVGGVFLWAFGRATLGGALVPIRDPRLPEALALDHP